MCELCDDDRVNLAAITGLTPDADREKDVPLPAADALMAEAEQMARDCIRHALAATTWGGRWRWWQTATTARKITWDMSYLTGQPLSATVYTSMYETTPWGVTHDECWQRWMREAGGEHVPL